MTTATIESAALTDQDLRAIVALVYEASGITLHDGKRELVAARLQKRMRQLALPSYHAYLSRVRQDASGEELTLLLNAICTNHTSFFREPQHFEFLTEEVVPALGEKARSTGLDIWCAASSTGEEPVTIAMTLLEAGVPDFRLLATDLSTRVLETARQGVYGRERADAIAPALLRKYFDRGLGQQEGLVRVRPEVRRTIEYRPFNLVAPEPSDQRYDVIFCRNVMIYFDKSVQQRVVSMLEQRLAPGGYLFISHSESLNGIAHRMRWAAPAVYRKEQA